MINSMPKTGLVSAKDYEGALRDKRLNPVYALLSRYSRMTEQEIKNHIATWWYGADPDKLFEQAKQAGLISQKDGLNWQLS